jgi:hypothetical protein
MTYTVPLRRTSLQFSQMRFTLARTFMAQLQAPPGLKTSLLQELFTLYPFVKPARGFDDFGRRMARGMGALNVAFIAFGAND